MTICFTAELKLYKRVSHFCIKDFDLEESVSSSLYKRQLLTTSIVLTWNEDHLAGMNMMQHLQQLHVTDSSMEVSKYVTELYVWLTFHLCVAACVSYRCTGYQRFHLTAGNQSHICCCNRPTWSPTAGERSVLVSAPSLQPITARLCTAGLTATPQTRLTP